MDTKPQINLIDKSGPQPVHSTVSLVSNLIDDSDVREGTIGNTQVFQLTGTHQPVRVTLQQPLGTDFTLLELNKRRAGFALKITFSVLVPSDGGVASQDILDVDCANLIPDQFYIDVARNLVVLCLISKSRLNFIPLNQSSNSAAAANVPAA
ncbi:MAG: hypothetical protein JWM11_5315 [Planctomycetaceae bacterium]|nr:hypothetical protein [Planctomycetaceae bacterium]